MVLEIHDTRFNFLEVQHDRQAHECRSVDACFTLDCVNATNGRPVKSKRYRSRAHFVHASNRIPPVYGGSSRKINIFFASQLVYISRMSETRAIPIRLPDDVIARLDAAAAKTSIGTRAAVMKFCINSFLDYFEANGETSLPINWREIIKDLDQRTHRYARLRLSEDPALKVADDQIKYRVGKKQKNRGKA